MNRFFQDLRYAVRMLLKSPGFTAIAVFTLALGIGANTAIFSFVNSLLLQSLPYPEPDKLVRLYETIPDRDAWTVPIAPVAYIEWQKQATLFESLGAVNNGDRNATFESQPERIQGAQISPSILTMLRIQPVLGRPFLVEEENWGQHRVVLVSHRLWHNQFGGQTNILGRPLTLDGESHTIIGVMPPNIRFPSAKVDIWTPFSLRPEQKNNRHGHFFSVFGRMKPNVTIQQVQTEMDLIAKRMAETSEENKGWGAAVISWHKDAVGELRPTLLVLMGTVGAVLLIACANIANLLLARSSARHKEFAIRAALGAGRGHIIRQLLTESVVLSLMGGALGLLLGAWGVQLLQSLAPESIPHLPRDVHLDGAALAFAFAISVGTGLVFGLAPAFGVARTILAESLKDGGRGSSLGGQHHRFRSGLVVAQIGLSFILLLGAGLLIRSFDRLLAVDLGFQTDRLVTLEMALPNAKYPDLANRSALLDSLLPSLRALPGVESVAVTYGLPLGSTRSQISSEIVGQPSPGPKDPNSAGYCQVSPGYFRTLRIPILEGRDFTDQDRTNTTPVIIVDEAFVSTFKLGTNALGKKVNVGDGGPEQAEIIGIVKTVRNRGHSRSPIGEMFLPLSQRSWGFLAIAARTTRAPQDFAASVRSELRRIDPDQPVQNIRTMEELVDISVANRKISMRLMTAFSIVALVMASVGLYGVLAYTVAQRTRDIGSRMALGAPQSHILGMHLRDGLKLAGIGLAVGIVGALFVTRLMTAMLFGVSAMDPVTYGTIALLLGLVALFACYIPAQRATRVDPMTALRYD